MAPSRYDWKIVDWDVKPQHNQHQETHFLAWAKLEQIAVAYMCESHSAWGWLGGLMITLNLAELKMSKMFS